MHEARRRSKRVADSVEGQRCHRIGMCCFVHRERYQLTGLTYTVRRPTVSGMRSVVADRNSPGNLNDLSCSTKPSRLSAALPSKFGSLIEFFPSHAPSHDNSRVFPLLYFSVTCARSVRPPQPATNPYSSPATRFALGR
jgi:hypothetical protein